MNIADFRSMDPNPWEVIVPRDCYLFFKLVFESVFPKLYVTIFTMLFIIPIIVDLIEKEGSLVLASCGASNKFLGPTVLMFLTETTF